MPYTDSSMACKTTLRVCLVASRYSLPKNVTSGAKPVLPALMVHDAGSQRIVDACVDTAALLKMSIRKSHTGQPQSIYPSGASDQRPQKCKYIDNYFPSGDSQRTWKRRRDERDTTPPEDHNERKRTRKNSSLAGENVARKNLRSPINRDIGNYSIQANITSSSII